MPLFDRVAELVVGQSGKEGLLIKDLRISFSIEKTLTETLNTSTIRIYNLKPSNRKLVETPNNAVILKAGYKQDIGAVTIFVGIVRRSLTVREGVDWVTELELDDGLIAYRDSKFSTSFAPGSKAVDVLTQVAAKFGITVGKLPPAIAEKIYPDGFSFVGRARDAMSKVCAYLGLEWSIQNQTIQVLKKGGYRERTAIVLSPQTGMIGSPQLEAKTMSDKLAAKQGLTTNSDGVVTKKSDKLTVSGNPPKDRLEVQGYKVESLMQPTVLPGDVVKVVAEGLDNFFKVEKATFQGDTHGSEWVSEFSLRFIN
jgi:hypothetical protein